MQWRILPPLSRRPRCLSCSLPCSTNLNRSSPNRPSRPALASLPRLHSAPIFHHPEPEEQNKPLQRTKSSTAPTSVETTHIDEDNSAIRKKKKTKKKQSGCVFLPSSSSQKKKQLTSQKVVNTTITQAVVEAKQEDEREPERLDSNGSARTASRVASLERFEYESWSSSAILDGDDEGSMQSFFDLPLELIKSSQNGPNSPVKAAFVFESDRKGSLTKTKSKLAPRKSDELSNRHVMFSTSPASQSGSPSSGGDSPTMLKAREEFHAFLEARSAWVNLIA